MADHVLTDSHLWLAEYDFTGVMNALGIDMNVEMQDATTFGTGATRKRLPGLMVISARHEGLFDAQPADEPIFNSVGAAASSPMTIAPDGDAEGDRAFLTAVHTAAYSPGGRVGEMFAFSLDAEGDRYPMSRGVLGHNSSKSSTGSGSAIQMGALLAGQSLYGSLHVISGSGGTLTVRIQSDDASGFPSATTRITFGGKTGADSEFAGPIAGPITDDWWRVDYTITGGTWLFAVGIGIAYV